MLARGGQGCRSPELGDPYIRGHETGVVSAHGVLPGVGYLTAQETLPLGAQPKAAWWVPARTLPYPQTYQQSREKRIRVLLHQRKCLQIAFFMTGTNLHLNET